jgi:hypothetical protein
VVRAARIAAVGRGGQILLSETTRALLGDAVPEGVSVRPIGEQLLKGIDRPEPLHELVIDGLPAPTPETPSNWRPSESEDTHAFAERMKHVIRRRVFEGIERSLNEPNR